jgi:glucose/arabinose dehydrogenase
MRRPAIWLLFIAVLAIPPSIHAQADEEVPITRDSLPDTSQFQLEQVIDGLRHPLLVTHAGDDSGRIFVVEQTGRIWIVRDGVLVNTPFINLSGIVSQDVLRGFSERGLLGLAFHPDYAANGLFYVNYTDQQGTTHVVEYSISADNPDMADPESARVLLSISQPYSNHNGGDLVFGPDGYLYISVGDGGSGNDPQRVGQDPANLLGTILRIDVDNSGEDTPYAIPDDNPFFTNPALAPEVWAWGLRNVWRMSFDRATGDFYLADVGQNAVEEVNFQPADSPGGENYGWPAYEGSRRNVGSGPETEVVWPIVEYANPSQGCSVTGGYVYRGEAIPELVGAYIFGDWCSGRIWAAYRDHSGEWHHDELFNEQMQISSFGENEDGELYVVNYRGSVYKFVPAS